MATGSGTEYQPRGASKPTETASLTTLRLGKNTWMVTSADAVQSRAKTRESRRLRGGEALCQSPLAFYPLRNRNQSSTDPLNISSPSTSQLCPVVSLAFNLQGFLTLHTRWQKFDFHTLHSEYFLIVSCQLSLFCIRPFTINSFTS